MASFTYTVRKNAAMNHVTGLFSRFVWCFNTAVALHLQAMSKHNKQTKINCTHVLLGNDDCVWLSREHYIPGVRHKIVACLGDSY